MKITGTPFAFAALLIISSLIFGCDENADSLEPIDTSAALEFSNIYDEIEYEQVAKYADLINKELIIISHIYAPVFTSGTFAEPESMFDPCVCLEYPSKIASVEVGEFPLSLTDQLIMPRYRDLAGVTINGFSYEDEVAWNITEKSGAVYTASCQNLPKLFPMELSCGSTATVDNTIKIEWNASEDEEDRLFVNFVWHLDGENRPGARFIEGFELDDDGSYSFPAASLKEYGIENYGYLIFRLLRYKAETADLGGDFQNALILRSVQSKIEVKLAN